MIGTFYRIKALSALGIKIHLHCFEYGRPHSEILEKLCKSVNYYPRRPGFMSHLSLLPYIISSRKSTSLLRNITVNDYPVLFDGLHSTYYLSHPSLVHRKKMVRVNNIEDLYYRSLARSEINPFRKLYYLSEAIKLKRYETVLRFADNLLAVSNTDHGYFSDKYGKCELIYPFHPFDKVECQPGSGDFILYHGDLSVNENARIAGFLIEEVFSQLPFKCIIAGKRPPAHLIDKISSFNNIKIIADPDNEMITGLISDAQINILPAMSSDGFKMKLLFALFSGRHCLVNRTMVISTGLGNLCSVAERGGDFVEKINSLMNQPFTEEMMREREKVLLIDYNNMENAQKISGLFFPE